MDQTPLGDWGERVAARHLENDGWTILHRRFRAGRQEIDLIAKRGEVVAFVEVKTRSTRSFGHPFDAIDGRKQADVRKAAEAWIRHNGRDGLTFRFDAMAVRKGESGAVEVEHLQDAWGY
ncbi:MAG: YraN family protein [Gemmatimonas sp.]|nr:YraN family protein [Gemmatimonas sp.]